MEAPDALRSSLLLNNQNQNREELDNIFNSSRHPAACHADRSLSKYLKRKINEISNESQKLWHIAGPVIFTSICFYSLGAVTQIFAGHLGAIELAAVAINDSVIAGLAFGTMMGMSSALETLSGQSVGRGENIHMLGVYLQRSWFVSMATALVLVLIYVFAAPILKTMGQSDEISEATGKFSIWMLPQLFAYTLYFPVQKFLQAQSKVVAMACITALALVFHVFLSWLCIIKLGWGLAGAAVALNFSSWAIALVQLIYILSGSCPGAWTGLSWLAFRDLGAFCKLSFASSIMICLEYWYFMIMIVLTGILKNPEIAVDSVSICANIVGWEGMIPWGFSAAISVRVANELGAGHANAAKFSVIVTCVTSMVIGILFASLIFITKDFFPLLFTNTREVMEAVSKLATLLGLTIVLYALQPVLTGVAVGAGWQVLVAYVNIGCYYAVGIPLGAILGYKFNLGAEGIWSGMVFGIFLQALILVFITYRTDWNKEASQAADRIRTWGGSAESEFERVA